MIYKYKFHKFIVLYLTHFDTILNNILFYLIVPTLFLIVIFVATHKWRFLYYRSTKLFQKT